MFKFFIRCLAADKTALGIDPTVTLFRGLSGNTVQYEMTVRSASGEEHRYRTQEPLFIKDFEELLKVATVIPAVNQVSAPLEHLLIMK